MAELVICIISLIVIGLIFKIGWWLTPHADSSSANTWINEKENIQVVFYRPDSGVTPAFIRDCLYDANTKLGLDLNIEDFKKSTMPRLFRGKYLIDGIIDYTKSDWKVNSNHYMMRRIMSYEEISNYGG